MKPILTTLTALAVVLAASTGAEAGKGPMVNIKPITPRVQIRPLRIVPRLPVGMNKKREQPSEAADGGPQPEPPTYQAKRTRPRTAKVNPVVRFIAPLPRTKPPIAVAVIDPDDLMTIPPDLEDLNAEALQNLEHLRDMATNGPNNAAPDVFGSPQDGQPGDEPGYGGSIDPFDHAANQAEADQENRDKQLDDFRATFGFDPANPGGGDTRQGRDFHTPAKNPGAAGGAINDPRGMASLGPGRDSSSIPTGYGWILIDRYRTTGGRTIYYTDTEFSGDRRSITRISTSPNGTTRETRHFDENGNVKSREFRRYDPAEGNTIVVQTNANGDEKYHTESGDTTPIGADSQPGAEGRGPGGNNNCGFNPMSGCTKKSVKIWDATVQPGAHQDSGGGSAGPSLGQEAVTNTGDSTFDSGVSGGGGGGGQPDPCRMRVGGCGGPIGEGGGTPGPAN